MYLVYKITSPSGKSYIGYTSKSVDIRFKQHTSSYNLWLNKKTKKGAIKLYYAFQKHGPDAFIKEILNEFETKEEALQFEIDMIKEYDSINDGYNICSGGEGGGGKPHSKETKLKMSIAAKGKSKSKEHKANMSKSGKNKFFSNDHKINLSNSAKGRKLSNEHKVKLSLVKKGKPAASKSEETKLKISASNKGKKHSEETKLKLSKPIINENNIIFKTRIEASKFYNVSSYSTISRWVKENRHGLRYL